MSRLAPTLAAALSVILLLGALTEAGLRHTQPRTAATPELHPALAPHPSQLWSLRAGTHTAYDTTFTVDAQGLRHRPSDDAGLRVLTLGEETIFGVGLTEEQTLHGALQTAFDMGGINVQTGTGAAPGYSTEQLLQLLDTTGWALDPDLLVVGSLWADQQRRGFQDRHEIEQLGRSRPSLWLSAHSRLWQHAHTTFLPPRPPLLARWLDSTEDRQLDPRVPVREYRENIHQIIDQAITHSVGVVLLSPCSRTQASEGNASLERTPWSRSAPTAPPTEPAAPSPGSSTSLLYFETLKTLAIERQVPLVDVCDVIRHSGIELDALYLDERNPSALANRLLALRLVSTLRLARWPRIPLLPSQRNR